MMSNTCKTLVISFTLLMLAGCSVPEFYLDVHHLPSVNVNEPLSIDVFITNSRTGTIVHIETIQLTGELARTSELIPGRNGIYSKLEGSDAIIAEPDRRLTQFETGAFSLTIRPQQSGEFSGTFVFNVNEKQISHDISVTVK